jgi:uncharacterized protein YkwD
MMRFHWPGVRAAGLSMAIAVSSTVVNPISIHAGARADCQFILGFKTLHDTDPGDVGNCTANQYWMSNGDATQPTDRGTLVWRKTDNFTAFTDGASTWVYGPFGLQKRFNTERFAWEVPGGKAKAGGDPNVTQSWPGDMAAQLFNLVNDDRTQNGLQPIVLSAELSRLAQDRAQGLLAARGPLSHYDVSGNLVLRDIVTENKIAFVTAGENLADNNFTLPQTVPVANTSLMNSPPHRANILNSGFNQMGVGVAGPDGGGGYYYYVELFIQTS